MKVFNRTAHKALWIWLSANPGMDKLDWLGWKRNGGDYDEVESHCFACGFAEKCNDCPLEWPGKHCNGIGDEGLYGEWEFTEDPQERASLALQIANLPVKEGVETE